MKKTLIPFLVVPFLFACETQTPPVKSEPVPVKVQAKDTKALGKISTKEGYTLLKQQCFSCHLEKMGMGQGGSKIAPPMVRVQEHYKPLYPNRADFVNAVSEWVKNPKEEKSNMPGAIRKFNLMPAITNIEDGKLALLAGALFDAEFGMGGKMKGQGKGKKAGLQLNNGKKWKLKPTSIQTLQKMDSLLKNFKSGEVKDYQALGTTLFQETKPLLLDKEYEGKLFDQLHIFFASVEGSMRNLMAVKSTEDGDKHILKLKEHFSKFPDYFE